MQRLRLRFSRGDELKYISHLDLMRLWSRALRRAGVSLAYSEGFSPHPRISLAAPLPTGVSSEAELMDINLQKTVSPHFFIKAVRQQLPKGIDLIEVQQIPPTSPSLQSQVRCAEYVVVATANRSGQEMQAAISALLQAESLPWQHMRDTGPRHYDLRSLIEDVWLTDDTGSIFTLGMQLRCDSQGTGRPEQVMAALGTTDYPISIHRTKLMLAGS
ncbi:MAG: TIGR03936 family radical SAM-associated protein [Chloroflexi bacterium]|nr:TIGR03936 family radical SAM-associated protein [Chloroflexota bacterium]